MAQHEVISTHRTWAAAMADAHKSAMSAKRRGLKFYRHHVRSVPGRVVTWRVTRRVK
jgi:hypothetical protein